MTGKSGIAVGRLMGNNPPGVFKVGDPSLVLPETFMGLEFEIENFPRDFAIPQDVANFWQIKEDGSLRNRGMEFVFNQPLFGKDITAAVTNFLEWQKKTKITTSIRTGLHAHLDVRELDIQSLVSFLMIYTALEPLIYKWVGASREESNFCVPFYYSDDALTQAYGIVSGMLEDEQELLKIGKQQNRGRHAAERFERYAGLNLQALHRFGSVEFRHMPMIFDKERIFEWLNLIFALKKEGKARTPEELAELFTKSKYNSNLIAKELGPLFDRMLSNFELKSDLKAHVCQSAFGFTKLGQVRKWQGKLGKYSGTNPFLDRMLRGAAAVAPPPAPPMVNGDQMVINADVEANGVPGWNPFVEANMPRPAAPRGPVGQARVDALANRLRDDGVDRARARIAARRAADQFVVLDEIVERDDF
jgi:hypothetical protein